MTKELHDFARPFDAKAWLAGEPAGCRNPEWKPEILKVTDDGRMYGIIHYLTGHPGPMAWAPDGLAGTHPNYPHDLVMLPLFLIDGKPVFVGDEIQGGGEVVKAKAHFTNEAGMWRWPSPKKAWPKISMSDDDIRQKFDSLAMRRDMWTSFANAIIDHECEAGNLVTDKQASHWILIAAERASQAAYQSARSGESLGKLYFENLLQTVKEIKL